MGRLTLRMSGFVPSGVGWAKGLACCFFLEKWTLDILHRRATLPGKSAMRRRRKRTDFAAQAEIQTILRDKDA